MVTVIICKDSWMCWILNQSINYKIWLIQEIVVFFSSFFKYTSGAMLDMWMNWTLVQKLKWLCNIWGKHEAEDGSSATPSLSTLRVCTLIMLNKNKEACEEFSESSFLYNTLLVSHSPLLKTGGVRGWSGIIYPSKKLITTTSNLVKTLSVECCITLCTGNFLNG